MYSSQYIGILRSFVLFCEGKIFEGAYNRVTLMYRLLFLCTDGRGEDFSRVSI